MRIADAGNYYRQQHQYSKNNSRIKRQAECIYKEKVHTRQIRLRKGDNEFLVARGIRVTDEHLMKSAFDTLNGDILINFKSEQGDVFKMPIVFKNKRWTFDTSKSNEKSESQFEALSNIMKKTIAKANNKKLSDTFDLAHNVASSLENQEEPNITIELDDEQLHFITSKVLEYINK